MADDDWYEEELQDRLASRAEQAAELRKLDEDRLRAEGAAQRTREVVEYLGKLVFGLAADPENACEACRDGVLHVACEPYFVPPSPGDLANVLRDLSSLLTPTSKEPTK